MSNENSRKKTRKNPIWIIIQVVMILAIVAALLMYVNAHINGKRYDAVSDIETKADTLSEDIKEKTGDDPLDAVTDFGGSLKDEIVGAIADSAVEQISDKVIEEVIKEQAAANGFSDEKTQEIIDSVSDEDRDKVEEIVRNHMDSEMVDKASEYMTSGDKEGFMGYAMSELTPEEIAELVALYGKYAQ